MSDSDRCMRCGHFLSNHGNLGCYVPDCDCPRTCDYGKNAAIDQERIAELEAVCIRLGLECHRARSVLAMDHPSESRACRLNYQEAKDATDNDPLAASFVKTKTEIKTGDPK